jgi:hypothetical protein
MASHSLNQAFRFDDGHSFARAFEQSGGSIVGLTVAKDGDVNVNVAPQCGKSSFRGCGDPK